MLPFRAKPLGAGCVVCAVLVAAGCGKSRTTELESPTAEKLRTLHDVYQRANIRLGRPPASMADLLPEFKEQGKNPAEVLRSPNDGADFEIVWGVELRRLKARGDDVPVIAFEKHGKDGKRHVLRARERVDELTDGELRSAKFPDGYYLPF
jgi:hypothetical protein